MYLILLTIGFGEIVRIFFLNFEPTGSAEGLGGMFPHTNLLNVYMTVAIVMFFINRIGNSHFGRAMEAALEDEDAAETLGVDLTTTKLLAFSAGGFTYILAKDIAPSILSYAKKDGKYTPYLIAVVTGIMLMTLVSFAVPHSDDIEEIYPLPDGFGLASREACPAQNQALC